MLESVGSPVLWGAFLAFVAVVLALDLGVFNRKAHEVSPREAIIWSAVWICLALIFNVFVWLQWGSDIGKQFLTGYLIEKALSVDNLFVFYMVFATFKIPLKDQHRVLFWGIVGALFMRAGMVIGGTALLATFHWVVYVFGGVLIATGIKMLARPDDEPDLEQSRIFRAVRRVIPTTNRLVDSRMFTREAGLLVATPMLLALILIELMDVVFAIDSIMAIFAISRDPFIVFTSNIFAILGLRSLYFVLASVAKRFVYLQPGLALILIFVGVKLAISHWIQVPIALSLFVVAFLLIGSILASIRKERADRRRSASAIDEAAGP